MSAETEPPFEPEARVRTTVWDPELPEGSTGTVTSCDRIHSLVRPDWDVVALMDNGQVWTFDPTVLEPETTQAGR